MIWGIAFSIVLIGCAGKKDTIAENGAFVSLFDGTSLAGWEGDPVYWRVEGNAIVGEITPETLLDRNSFLIWRGGTVRDFELKAVFRVSAEGNSGINYRSEEVDGVPFALRGYQADIDGAMQYSGMNYEERRRSIVAWPGQRVLLKTPPGPVEGFIQDNQWTLSEVIHQMPDLDDLKSNIRRDDWNEMHIVARKHRIRHYINGVLFSEVHDRDRKNRRREGLLGVQVHVGPPMKIEYKSILLKRL